MSDEARESVPLPEQPGWPLELQAERWDHYDREGMLADMLAFEAERFLYGMNPFQRAKLVRNVDAQKSPKSLREAQTKAQPTAPTRKATKAKAQPKATTPAAAKEPATGTCPDCGAGLTKWVTPGISRAGYRYAGFWGCPEFPHKLIGKKKAKGKG